MINNNIAEIKNDNDSITKAVWLFFLSNTSIIKTITGKSHTEDGGYEFGIAVMQFLNDQCNKWKAAEDIDYSVYGTPIESTTWTFAKGLHKRFGIVEGITDRDYVTNSYHIPVFEKINAFDKLAIESDFQKLSPGGWNQHNLL